MRCIAWVLFAAAQLQCRADPESVFTRPVAAFEGSETVRRSRDELQHCEATFASVAALYSSLGTVFVYDWQSLGQAEVRSAAAGPAAFGPKVRSVRVLTFVLGTWHSFQPAAEPAHGGCSCRARAFLAAQRGGCLQQRQERDKLSLQSSSLPLRGRRIQLELGLSNAARSERRRSAARHG
jgi:hypothetical protein